jgi:hypothetical protein
LVGKYDKMILSPEEKAQYLRDGYLLLDPEIPPNLLDQILDDLLRGNEEKGLHVPYLRPYLNTRGVSSAWIFSDSVRALATAPKILGVLEELYGVRPLPFQTLNFPFGTEQYIHSDVINFNSIPSGYVCAVWVALEDTDMDNGPVFYYPGSHTLLEVTKEHVDNVYPPPTGEFSADEFFERYAQFIKDRIARAELKPLYWTLKKGQALLWTGNLLHGGAPRKDRTRTRHSQVTHYFFEGCQFYAPLYSHGTNLGFLDPFRMQRSESAAAITSLSHLPPDAGYVGCFDGADGRLVHGWACDGRRPGVPVEVDIYDGSCLLTTGKANWFREDLAIHIGDNGFHGFQFDTPERLRDGVAHTLAARVAGTDVELTNSPIRLEAPGTDRRNYKEGIP